jgi:hypothetical protein
MERFAIYLIVRVNTNLQIREDTKTGIYIANVTEKFVSDQNMMLELTMEQRGGLWPRQE